MLKLSFIEFIFRAVPEEFLCILFCYIIAKKPLEREKYIISSIGLALTVYFVRFLNIDFGIHTIIASFIFIFLLIFVNKFNIITAVSAVFIVDISLTISELSYMYILQKLNIDFASLIKTPLQKIINTSPTFLILIIIISLFYFTRRFIDKRRYSIKNVSN